ncbi:hypothetical protein BCR39DRAFT_487517, partial [Naematelia encephala]
MNEAESSQLVNEINDHGGWVNTSLFRLGPIDGMGTGAVAIVDIPEQTPLFHLPLDQLLMSHSSDIKNRLSSSEWDGLGQGWIPLILAMMWETHIGEESRWQAYLSSMPVTFETPMFWDEDARRELQGTEIENTIGREEADNDYRTILRPVLERHPELFPSSSNHFTLEAYHMHGSRILSRSFTIPAILTGALDNDDDDEDDDDDDDDDDEEDANEVAMIPMADMLNAVTGLDNARLFSHEEATAQSVVKGKGYTMISTSAIKAGEQILNTYDVVPNSGLLRKYGHVDTLPLPAKILSLLSDEEIGQWPLGNPADEVSIAGDLVVEIVTQRAGTGKSAEYQARVDRWLDEQDDTFVLSFTTPIEPQLIVFIRILIFDSEWQRFLKKGKLPLPVIDDSVAKLLFDILDARSSRYLHSLKDDLILVTAIPPVERRQYMSAVVRIGERRVIAAARRTVRAQTTMQGAGGVGKKKS